MNAMEKMDLAVALHSAWKKYTELLGEPPHGTLPQMKALVEFVHLTSPPEVKL